MRVFLRFVKFYQDMEGFREIYEIYFLQISINSITLQLYYTIEPISELFSH
jgi:hypothetical protein